MKREIKHIDSHFYGGNTDIAVYGKCGVAIVLFSSGEDNILQSEKDGLIEMLLPLLKKGKCKIYSVANPSNHIWKNSRALNEKSEMLLDFNLFLTSEVLPYIFNSCGTPVPIITAGALEGAYHAANTFFRRPDIFIGTIAVSGQYDLSISTGEYFDDNCYYNSPVHFLPNLTDPYWMTFLKSRRHIYLASGEHDSVCGSTLALSSILTEKNILHDCHINQGNIENSLTAINKQLIESISRIMSKSV